VALERPPPDRRLNMNKEKPALELLKQLMAENPRASEREMLKLFRAEIWGEEEKFAGEMVDSLIENERAANRGG
jgi:hypothetical protein